MAHLKNKIDIDDYFIGKVLEIDRTTREISVHIPQLMPAIASEELQMSKIQTTTNTKISGLEYSNRISIRNSFWTRPLDFEEPLPKVGSKVTVWIMDGNPRMAFWDKFNPNNNYEVIDEEKYSSLFKLRMNLQDIDIFEKDTLVFNLPENSSIAYNAKKRLKQSI